MIEIQWEEVKTGSFASLDRLVLSSSTSIRRQSLRELREKIIESQFSPEILTAIFELLFRTLPIYADRASRQDAQQCLQGLLRAPTASSNVLPVFVQGVLKHSASTQLPTDALVMVEWCCLLLQHLRAEEVFNLDLILDVIYANALSFETCLHPYSKFGLKHSAITVTRRALRSIFSSQHGMSVLRAAVSHLTGNSHSGPINAPLLGVIAGVTARSTGLKPIMEELKPAVFQFYTKEIVGSRHILGYHIADGLKDFFASYTTIEDLRHHVWPSLEKAVLRAPEVVLNDVLLCLAAALADSLDISEDVQHRFAKPLIANIKSSNVSIRNGAIKTFETLLTRCKSEDHLLTIANEVVTPIKTNKVPNPEQRALHLQLLQKLAPSPKLSQKLLLDLNTVFIRESVELSLDTAVTVFFYHLSFLLRNQHTPAKESFSEASKGCAEKRINIRKIWLARTGELLWTLDDSHIFPSDHLMGYVSNALSNFHRLFEEIYANPLQSAQNGSLSLAYMLTALACQRFRGKNASNGLPLIEENTILEKVLTFSPKISFLFNPKVYGKLVSYDDYLWNVRALSSVCKPEHFTSLSKETQDAWAQAFIYNFCSSHVPTKLRGSITDGLKSVYLETPETVASAIIRGIWNWLQALTLGDRESPALHSGTGANKLSSVIKAIARPPREWSNQPKRRVLIETQLIRLLVICRLQLVPGIRWIDLALQMGIDPGDLVRRNSEACLTEIICVIDDPLRASIEKTEEASWDAAVDLAFVAPDTMTPLLVSQFVGDLQLERVTRFTPTDIAIARTPADVTYVDVLASKAKPTVSSKDKDYDVLKWEEELKAQLAEKRGQKQKKLTADERAKVNAQLAKEAEIRADVIREESVIRRGTGIVGSLSRSPLAETETWIHSAIKCLTELSQAGVGALVGDAVSVAYLSCGDKVSERLGSIRPFIGIATLRIYGKTYLSPNLEEEPLNALVTRILYRLRLACEQLPFDSSSLSYFLPLLFAILDKNGIEESENDAGEQVLLVLQILAVHTGSCSDSRLPREAVLTRLISGMQRYNQHYKLIRDTLLDFCRCLASNTQPTELEVLLQASIVPDVPVRTAVLQAILDEMDLTDLDFSVEIWLECHDHVAENAEIAAAIWNQNALQVDENSAGLIINFLRNKDAQLRGAAARALADFCRLLPSSFQQTVKVLKEMYREEVRPKPVEKDAYGIPKKVDNTDYWEPRHGIALAFKYLAGEFKHDEIVSLLQFLIDEGPLIDLNHSVRQLMSEAGATVISQRGHEKVEQIMQLLETTLETSDKDTEKSDQLNEAVIVLYGSSARHLKAGDSRINTVIRKLLSALSTPSENVQYAVADCLPPVIRLSLGNVSEYIQEMVDQLLQSKNYASRRGAAYGLAGVVKGKGISAIREYRLMARLEDALDNKKEPTGRQGAVMAYELFSFILGRLFEPYVIQIVPQLLASFGDPIPEVREATLDAAKTCFASLSSYGVQQILPTLLEGLDDTQWRSKKGACDLLGAMAYLDPQQLATSLPELIPPLTEVLTDSHKEVRNSANRSLQRFGDVITNPEVKSLVKVLLQALSDPTKHTDAALDALIKVQFVHYLDSPSLALVVRILERGLGDRSGTKRKAAQIIGSLAHLTEKKDILGYLPTLVSGIRVAVVDPVPATRGTASKALGSLIEKLGEDALPDLIPSLMMALKTDNGAGDRMGSAQALSEVLAGLGTSRLEETLPTILQNATSSKPAVREGFMTLFIFLPACFGNSFATYLHRIIPSILAGLADDVDSIRDISLRAGRLVVKNFATKSIHLLLPELERGLADYNHRIRLSSVELVGDLLFNLTGLQNKPEVEDSEELSSKASSSLLKILGEEKRNRVLASLYICRLDTYSLVRNAAVDVYKALVPSPRILKELIPTLSHLIIKRLSDSDEERKIIAGGALSELIKKVGEFVLITLLPLLQEGLITSTDGDTKQGICIALREVIASSSVEALEIHEKTIIQVVRTALGDADDEVRETAATAFDALQRVFGKRTIDQVLPDLLASLRTKSEAQQALSALLTLLTSRTRADIILPNIIPTLLTKPVTAFNARALASLAQVAGHAMVRRLATILSTLMDAIIAADPQKTDGGDPELQQEMINSFDTILGSVEDSEDLQMPMNVILSMMRHDDHYRRAHAAQRLARLFSTADDDLISPFYPDLIHTLLVSFSDRDTAVVEASWEALVQLTSHMPKEEMEELVEPTREVIEEVCVAEVNLAGFCLPKGISAVLPIFLQGLLNGDAETRVQSSLGIAGIIDRTSPEALRPFVTQLTGPLIRVVSERSSDLKSAIFLALIKLLKKVPLFVKPFLPQLQRTFAKGLADTSSEPLRQRSAQGLSVLITLAPRIDPLVAELVSSCRTSDREVKESTIPVLREILSKAKNINDTSKQSILSILEEN